jgi:hypothetical protein
MKIKADYISLALMAGLVVAVVSLLVIATIPRHSEHDTSQTSLDHDGSSTQPSGGWFIADSTFTSCIESKAPADKIRELREGGQEPNTRENSDEGGNLISVEVTIANGDFDSTVWTYYRNEAGCEAALPVNKTIPNKYR